MSNSTIEYTLPLTKKFEGFRANPYPDYAGYSIGYGHQIKPGENLTYVTEEQATDLLRQDLQSRYDALNKNLKVSLTAKQKAAILDRSMSHGVEQFNNSTLLELINSKASIVDIIKHWTSSYVTVNNGTTFVQGLFDRRIAEIELFVSGLKEKFNIRAYIAALVIVISLTFIIT